jgi:8-oxo-dGTP diphosphatase
VAIGDGNGWVFCDWADDDRERTRGGSPHRHWGRNGAAGLVLLRRRERLGVLLQLRAEWTHQGGLWGLPGGARDSHETVAAAAKREAEEEAAVPEDAVAVLDTWVGTDHRVWTYTYVIARVIGDVAPRVTTPESDELAWVDLDGVPDLPLHPYLKATWDELRARIETALPATGIAEGQE